MDRARSNVLPTSFHYPAELPVSQNREAIATAIRKHPVVIVAGETGSGKTTQLPKICLELGRGREAMIGCTQPRRLAARTMAERVAEELQVKPGSLVGSQVRFSDRTTEDTRIKFMTDGIVLAETQQDRRFNRYDTLIIDEAHERSLNIDFLLGYVKRLLPKRPDLKVIITSATIDTGRFAAHFDDAPVITVTGRAHPVEVRYRPVDEDADVQSAIAEAIRECLGHGPGDILVFLSGEREIRETADFLGRCRFGNLDILPLYARLGAAEQSRVFHPGGLRRVVLATNVAETSLTVPGIRFVIDPGYARISRYSHRSKVQRLPVEPVSQASANQRRGRCGRIGPGLCLRLYSEEDFLARPAYTEPEIQRTALGAVILQMQVLGLGDIESFPFMDGPAPGMVTDGYRILQELGALDERKRLTRDGRRMARLPVDPRIARMLLQADREGALAEVLIIGAALSVEDPRERPLEAREAADAAHAAFQDPRSDFLGYLKLWQFFQEQQAALSRNRLRRLCQRRFLSHRRMREWSDIHRQLGRVSRGMKLRLNSEPAAYAAIHRSVLAGLLGHVGMREENAEYLGARNRRFRIFPGSGLAARPPRWLMSAALVETTRLYARDNAAIEPEWAEQVGSRVCRRSYSDPHWSRRSNRVVAREQVTLFGLPIVSGRRVSYARVNPAESRRLFILGALVRGEYRSDADWLKHNRALREAIVREEHKLRRHDVLAEEETVFAFFDERIPDDIATPRAFERWRKKVEQADPKYLFLDRNTLIRADARLPTAEQFPDHLEVAGTRLPLSYHFERGHPADGITLHLPVALLGSVEPARLDWLVPGLLPEKVTALLRSLPKALRRSFVPVPEYTRALLESMTSGNQPLTRAMALQLEAMTGVRVPDESWGTVPVHLHMNIRLEDAGRGLDSGRDLNALRERHAGTARRRLRAALEEHYHADNLTDWSIGALPRRTRVNVGGRQVVGHPALTLDGGRVNLRVFETAELAARHHRQGLRRLLVLNVPGKVKYLRRNLPLSEAAVLAYASLGSRDELVDDLLDCALGRVLAGHETWEARDLSEFEALRTTVQQELVRAATAICELVERILEHYHEIRLKLADRELEMHVNALDDIQSQLQHLVYPRFLREVPVERLEHYPRYLRGIQLRLERLAQAPDKDAERMGELLPFWNHYLECSGDPALDEYRWMLEEWRISLFAQELKTAVPVSPKRLRRLLKKTESVRDPA